MGEEQQQSTDDDIECDQRDRCTETEDYRTTDLLDRAAEIRSELGGNIEKLWRGLKGGVAETEDYRTTDLLDRAAEIRSELGGNTKKLGQGLKGGVAKDRSIIDNESESINEDIRINQPASEPTRTAKNQHRGQQ